MVGIVKIVDDPRATALALYAETHAHLAQPAGALDQVAAGWIEGDQIDDRALLGFREQLIRPPPIAGEFHHRDRSVEHGKEKYPNGARRSIHDFLYVTTVGCNANKPIYDQPMLPKQIG